MPYRAANKSVMIYQDGAWRLFKRCHTETSAAVLARELNEDEFEKRRVLYPVIAWRAALLRSRHQRKKRRMRML